MKIRKGKLSDAKEILKILNSTPEFGGGVGKENPPLSYVKAFLSDKNMNLALIAEEDKEMVGFIISEVWKKKSFSFLVYLWVKKDFRRKGVGVKLLKTFEKECKKLKLKKISFLVLQSNKLMQSWCKKQKIKRGDKFYYYAKKL
ncbi:MAG: GNAT family N-acetyltransferase [archaeon]